MPPRKVILGQAEQLIVERARQKLSVYLGLVHMTDEGRQAIPPAHLLSTIIPAIQNDALGHTVIVAPPGSIKTRTLMGACAWWLGRDPSCHVAYVCNSEPKAQERSMVIRDLMERSPQFRAVFPDCLPDKTRGWNQSSWFLKRKNLTDNNPSFLAVGMTGDIQGARVHRFVWDDINDDDNMRSELQRNQLKVKLETIHLPRMDDPALGRGIMISNRFHEDDSAQWAIDQGWTYIHIPAINEEGESYWPERWPRERLERPSRFL